MRKEGNNLCKNENSVEYTSEEDGREKEDLEDCERSHNPAHLARQSAREELEQTSPQIAIRLNQIDQLHRHVVEGTKVLPRRLWEQ